MNWMQFVTIPYYCPSCGSTRHKVMSDENIKCIWCKVNMKKKKLKQEHFEQFGEGLGLTGKQIKGAFQRMIKNKPKAFSWIDRSFLSTEMKTAYIDIIDSRYKQIGLK